MAQTTLCFDFGNTRQKYAVFKEDELQEVVLLDNANADALLGVMDRHKPDKTILSSVINHDQEVEQVLAASSRLHILSYKTILPFTTPVGKPATIGADRLALVAA